MRCNRPCPSAYWCVTVIFAVYIKHDDDMVQSLQPTIQHLQGTKAGHDEHRLLLTQTLGSLTLTPDTALAALGAFTQDYSRVNAALLMQMMQLLLERAPDKA